MLLTFLVGLMMATSSPSVLTVPIQPFIVELTTDDLKDIARDTAKKYKLNVEKFLDTLECEVKKRPDGSWDYKAQSDHIRKGYRENSWGMCQINLDWNPQVSKAQAQDPYWCAEWMAKAWRRGEQSKWSCYGKTKSSKGAI